MLLQVAPTFQISGDRFQLGSVRISSARVYPHRASAAGSGSIGTHGRRFTDAWHGGGAIFKCYHRLRLAADATAVRSEWAPVKCPGLAFGAGHCEGPIRLKTVWTGGFQFSIKTVFSPFLNFKLCGNYLTFSHHILREPHSFVCTADITVCQTRVGVNVSERQIDF